jgi:GNAT superfamily N-acetyltransferase
VQIRRARPDETEVVLDVLANAAAWLRRRGIAQWPERFPTDWVMPAIEAGETWLAELDAQIVGSLVVQWADPLSWAGYPSDAGYLHRLAVRRHGDGVGSCLLRWAEGHAAAEGKAYLRLDCVASNESLRAYYERAGYEHLGDVKVDEFIQSRYEKPVANMIR